MPALIRPNRIDVTDRYPMLAFTLQSAEGARVAEVVLSTDLALLGKREARNTGNFYSSREHGVLTISSGGSIYTVPPQVLARFIGAERLFFALATASAPGGQDWRVDVVPSAASPFVSLRGLTDRALRRVRQYPSAVRTRGGGVRPVSDWTGDLQPATPAPYSANPVQSADAAAPAPVPYNDGFGPLPPLNAVATPALNEQPNAGPSTLPIAQGLSGNDVDPESYGIEVGTYSEGEVPAVAAGLALTVADYSRTTRVVPTLAFTSGRNGTPIDRVVIHITDASTTSSTVNTFSSPNARASAHYLVGQDGEIIQFVSEADTAWHAKGANRRSIGIEHVAIKAGGADYPRSNGGSQHFDALSPSDAQYCESAALVSYLCDKYGLPKDRTTIIGHNEADPATTHGSCPTGNWDWDHFMRLVTEQVCAPQPTAQGLGFAEALDVANAATAATGSRLMFKDVPGNWKTDDFGDVSLTAVAWDSAPETTVAFVYFGHPALDDDGSPTAYHPDDTGDDRLSSGRDQNGWFGIVSFASGKAPANSLLDLRPEARGGDGKYPVIQQAANGDPNPGYYVSGTSKVIEGFGDHQQGRYYNARTVPYGALGGRLKRQGVDLGDYGLAIRHDEVRSSPFRLLDNGGSGKWSLGEVSRRVINSLGGNPSRNGNRVNYGNDYPTSFLIFPGFEDDIRQPFTEADIAPTVQSAMSRLAMASNARDLALLLALNEVRVGRRTPGKQALDRFLANPSTALPANYQNVVASLQANGFGFVEPTGVVAQGLAGQSDPDDHGMDGPVHDLEPSQFASAVATGLALTTAEYPDALVMVSPNFTRGRSESLIDRIVIHITSSSQSPYLGSHFMNPYPNEPKKRASSHYMVDQLGVVRQFVSEADTAWHAANGPMNRRSIGIEHVAVERGGARYGNHTLPYTPPTDIEYATSAGLVAHLCRKYNLPPDRTTIIGHNEANPTQTSKANCPTGAWDWDSYMGLVAAAYAAQTVVGAVGSVVDTVRSATGLSGGESWTINWDDVEKIPQPTDNGCWATAAAMILGWRDLQSVSPSLLAHCNNMDSSLRGGLAPADKRAFIDAVGLVVHPNACFTPEGFRDIVEANGPIWVTADVPGIHAIVVTGMYYDGNQYFVRITDPWDRVVGGPGSPGTYASTHSTGSQYIMTYEAFAAEFEAAGNIDRIQLAHAGGTQGHTINRGSAAGAGYALALEDTAKPIVAPNSTEPVATRTTASENGRSYDLAQLAGVVRPANALAGGAGMPAISGERVLLDDWPYIEEAGQRTQANVAIDWKFDGAAVGDIVITPAGGSVANGRSVSVRADIAPGAGTPDRTVMLVTVTTTFTKAGEPDQSAVNEVTLGGDGRASRNHCQPEAAPSAPSSAVPLPTSSVPPAAPLPAAAQPVMA
jgi:N-acetyl-anhydromuramyl-L-alanine amidase AmpD